MNDTLRDAVAKTVAAADKFVTVGQWLPLPVEFRAAWSEMVTELDRTPPPPADVRGLVTPRPMTVKEAREIFTRVWVYGVDMWDEERAKEMADAHRRLSELVNEWSTATYRTSQPAADSGATDDTKERARYDAQMKRALVWINRHTGSSDDTQDQVQDLRIGVQALAAAVAALAEERKA